MEWSITCGFCRGQPLAKSYKVLAQRAKCQGTPGAAFGYAGTREASPWVLPGLSSPGSNLPELQSCSFRATATTELPSACSWGCSASSLHLLVHVQQKPPTLMFTRSLQMQKASSDPVPHSYPCGSLHLLQQDRTHVWMSRPSDCCGRTARISLHSWQMHSHSPVWELDCNTHEGPQIWGAMCH